jgi:hypothetical protein
MWSVVWAPKYYKMPEFPCPSCKSTVVLDESTMLKRETLQSQKMHNSENWTPYDVDFRFSCMMVCNNKRCGEIVVVSGFFECEEDVVYDERGSHGDYFEFYRPKSMQPPPPVIPISPKLSDNCRQDLKAAFALLWVDVAACANRQRTMIEHLLDQLGIDDEKDDKPIGLHRRIDMLAKEHPEHGEILHALKEVGNAGSHEGRAAFKDVIECFELIEHVVTALIDRPQDSKMESARRLKAKYGRKPTTTLSAEIRTDIPADLTPPTSGGGD